LFLFEISPSSLPVVSARHRNASYAIACRLPTKTSARPSSPASAANVSPVRVGRRGSNYRSRLHSLHGGKRTGTIKAAAITQFSLSSSSSSSSPLRFALTTLNLLFVFQRPPVPLEPEIVIVNEGSCHLTDYENPTEAIWSMSSSMSSDCSENDPLSRYLGSQRRRRQRRPRRHLPPQPSREADSPSTDPAEQDRFI